MGATYLAQLFPGQIDAYFEIRKASATAGICVRLVYAQLQQQRVPGNVDAADPSFARSWAPTALDLYLGADLEHCPGPGLPPPAASAVLANGTIAWEPDAPPCVLDLDIDVEFPPSPDWPTHQRFDVEGLVVQSDVYCP